MCATMEKLRMCSIGASPIGEGDSTRPSARQGMLAVQLAFVSRQLAGRFVSRNAASGDQEIVRADRLLWHRRNSATTMSLFGLRRAELGLPFGTPLPNLDNRSTFISFQGHAEPGGSVRGARGPRHRWRGPFHCSHLSSIFFGFAAAPQLSQ